jgi:hypothetical protein
MLITLMLITLICFKRSTEYAAAQEPFASKYVSADEPLGQFYGPDTQSDQ